MKKRILSMLLTIAMIFTCIPAASFAATSSLDDVTFTVEKNSEAGLDGNVDITFEKSEDTYLGTLYLPGSADTKNLKLSWSGDITLKIDNVSYESGEAPVPEKGESISYTVTGQEGGSTFELNTMQGSSNVRSMFIDIDESKGTIEAMNSDSEKETSCYGSLLLDGSNMYMSMKGRGNWTWSHSDKKQYNITIYKDETYDKKDGVKLISDVKSKKWSILANQYDSSLLRNKIGLDLGAQLGLGLPSENIDIWLNGEYAGNYLLTPKNDYNAPEEGFMAEIDNYTDTDQFTVGKGDKITVKSKPDEMQLSDIKSYVQKAWNSLSDSESDAYLEYFDLDSWAKLYMLNELFKDLDVCTGSIFFTKESLDDSDKLVAGTVWDLDNTLGRIGSNHTVTIEGDLQQTGEGWYLDSINRGNNPPIWQLLGKHESFMKRVYELYNEYQDEYNHMAEDLDTNAGLIADSARMDFYRWSYTDTGSCRVKDEGVTLGTGKYAVTYKKTDSWDNFVYNLREYITKRVSFFNDTLIVEVPEDACITGNSNANLLDNIKLTADVEADEYRWQISEDGKTWTDIEGENSKTYETKAVSSMDGKSIRCIVRIAGYTIETTRVAKVNTAAVAVLDPVTVTVDESSHEHKFDNWVVTKEATCTEEGIEEGTCECGEVKTREIPKIDHKFTEWEVTKAATYKAAGVKKRTCECGLTETVTIKKLTPKTQKITVKKSSYTYKVSKLKKKSVSISLKASAKGKLSYKVTKGTSKNITVTSKGKVKLKKGCKAGTYKVTITAAEAEKGKYKKATKVVTIKVKK